MLYRVIVELSGGGEKPYFVIAPSLDTAVAKTLAYHKEKVAELSGCESNEAQAVMTRPVLATFIGPAE